MTRSLHIPHNSSRMAAQKWQGDGAYSVAYRAAPPFPASTGAACRSDKVGSDQTTHRIFEDLLVRRLDDPGIAHDRCGTRNGSQSGQSLVLVICWPIPLTSDQVP
jgi:hypothetical protein